MRLKFGTTWLGDPGGARFVWGRQLLRSAGGVGYGFLYSVQCQEVTLRVADQYDCTVKMAAVEVALAQVADLTFYHDNGLASQNSGQTESTFSGVRCVSGPTWLPTPGGWATHKSFAAAFEWETSLPGSAGLLLDFKEQLTLSGGNPVRAVLRPIDGSPVVLQTTVPKTEYRAVQDGSAVGYSARPAPLTVSPPLYYSGGVPLLPVADSTTQFSGQRSGQGLKGFGVSWHREYVSATPLLGVPQEWLG